VVKVVKQHWDALQYAEISLLGNGDVVRESIKIDPRNISIL